MRKFLSAALPAIAAGALLTLPAAPAQAQTAACEMASEVIRSAFIAAPDHRLDRDAQRALTTKLQSIFARDAERDAIDAFVQAVNGGDDLDQAYATFTGTCKA
ncbi:MULTISPECIES: hypothetical protein [unclassified Nocardia]|uniref:hypothetical protein n=1 Tax=unclassified Nocardia TaxID=2637762 RepID=UPI001CE4AFDD|nr:MULTISPECIES: hypothetical protein [unclassified Nocardia]